jgi:hypothetical protein
MIEFPVYAHSIGHGQTILTFVTPKDPVKLGEIVFKGDGARPRGETKLMLWTSDGAIQLTLYEALDLAINNLRGLSWVPEKSPIT